MHATDTHNFADLGHLRLQKERAFEQMRHEGALNDGAIQSCVTFHREVIRRLQGTDDRDVLDKECANLGKDIGQLNTLREMLMQSAAQDRDPVAIEKIQAFLGTLERLMRTLSRLLDEQTTHQWAYLERRRNPAMASPKPSPQEKNEKQKNESGEEKKKKE